MPLLAKVRGVLVQLTHRTMTTFASSIWVRPASLWKSRIDPSTSSFSSKRIRNVSSHLGVLRSEFPCRDIEILNEDAREALPTFCNNLEVNDRAVVFLDPFATEVSWQMLERLARTLKVDCWILFPLSAIARMMPRENEPSPELAHRLDLIFGGREHWQDLYSDSTQMSFFEEEPGQRRVGGSSGIALQYRRRLMSVFAQVAPSGRVLRNAKNSPIFQMIFAASNPRGAPIAVRMAKHIIDHW